MNQCDGCRAGRPLIRYHKGHYRLDSTSTVHIMGSYKTEGDRIITTGYADLMSCCKLDYKEET